MTEPSAKEYAVAGYLTGPAHALPAGYRNITVAYGEESPRPTTFGFEQFSRTVSPVRERTTLIVRREQVQTVEEVYRFVGSKLPVDPRSRVGTVQARQERAGSGEAAAPVPDEAIVAPERIKMRAMPAFEVVAFMVVGALCAVLISPYSPFKAVAPHLVVIVMPASAIGAMLYALYQEFRHRAGAGV